MIYAYIVSRPTDVADAIIIQNGISINSLTKRIVKAYLTISTINNVTKMFPITRELSHWMVMLQVEDGEYYLISSSPQHYIEIINPDFDGYTRHNIYKYQHKEYHYSVIKLYNVLDVNINVLEYCQELMRIYIKRGEYKLFKNNCHKITIAGLCDILHVKHGEELTVDYSMRDILKNVWKNRNKFIDEKLFPNEKNF